MVYGVDLQIYHGNGHNQRSSRTLTMGFTHLHEHILVPTAQIRTLRGLNLLIIRQSIEQKKMLMKPD